MDLRQVRYFVAVYEEGSFSRAAVRENCTQPGLSVQIAQLETMLGQRLFDRNPRGVTPTIAGKHFYSSCTAILGAVKAARQRMLDLAGSVAGRINVGVPPSFSKIALPTVLRRYAEEHPHVEVRIAEAYSGTLSQWVVAGELELAIVTEPPADLGLETTRFFRDRLVLVRGARTGRRKEAASLKLAVPSGRHSLRQKIDSHQALGATRIERTMEIDGLTATLELVRASDWATVLPTVAVADDVRDGRLTAERITGPELWLDYFLVQTKDLPLSVANQRFLALLASELNVIAGRSTAREDEGRRGPKRSPLRRLGKSRAKPVSRFRPGG